jgi:hypothetical protein
MKLSFRKRGVFKINILYSTMKDATFVTTNSDVRLNSQYYYTKPMPVAARSKVWVFGRSLAGVAGSNPTRGMDVCLL